MRSAGGVGSKPEANDNESRSEELEPSVDWEPGESTKVATNQDSDRREEDEGKRSSDGYEKVSDESHSDRKSVV